MKKIKIALVDDHKVLCESMEKIINLLDDMIVIHQSYSGRQFINYLESTHLMPDVVLLDIDMPEMNGYEVLQIITEKYPTVKAIMLTYHNEPYYILRMIECGAVGYLSKSMDFNELSTTIREVVQQGHYFDEAITRLLLERKSIEKKHSIKLDFDEGYLTNSEIKVLELICHQKTANEMAEDMELSVRTIQNHRASLLKKTKVRNSVGLVLFAITKKIFRI